MADESVFSARDEMMHAFDPSDVLWNESWFFSWMPTDDKPAAFYRLGLLPNQQRGWLWFFLHNGNEWLCFEESRLALDHFDVKNGASYDKWGLRFGFRPIAPLKSAEFFIEGIARVQGGPRAGALVPVRVQMRMQATSPCFSTGRKSYSDDTQRYEQNRFEQSLAVEGTVEFDGKTIPLKCEGHRDRSWGTRQWRMPYINADLHLGDMQIYWAGTEQPMDGAIVGYIKRGNDIKRITNMRGQYDYIDNQKNLGTSRLLFETEDQQTLELILDSASDSILWNMAHTGEPWDNWRYWRTKVIGRIAAENIELRGWFDASRYGCDT